MIKDTDEGVAKIVGQDKLYEVLGIVGVDEKNDLALLKIKGIKGKPLILNKDDSIAIGDEVFAVGNPKGLEGTFSQGIVSSIRKSEKLNLLQITASISEGSSGGAVLNDKGQVVGVAVGAIESGQSLNFAIPVSLLRSLVLNQKRLVSLKNNTTVTDNKTQSSSSKITQQPNNLPKIKTVPQRTSLMAFKIPDLVEENLFGNVKSVKQILYVPVKKFDEWVLGEPVATSDINYNINGDKESSEGVSYSESGIGESECSFSVMLMAIRKTLGYPATYREINFYDYSIGMVTEEFYLKCENCIGFGTGYELVNKFLIKFEKDVETRFDTDGKMFLKTIAQKERDGKLIELRYDGDGTLSSKEIIYKDRIGEVKETWYPAKVNKDQLELSSKTITTETQGQEKENYICIKDKDTVCNSLTIRDKSTKLILRKEYGTTVWKYDYEFDSNGNWTKQTVFQQVKKLGKTYFEPNTVKVREITYY